MKAKKRTKVKKRIVGYLLDIIIIIIGVVIAFYLTKYGERANRNQNEKDVTNQIYFELKDNLLDLERDFLVHRIGLFSNLRVIKFIDNREEVSDSLIMDFYWMTRDEYIFANTSGYENLKTFGINLIKDDSLRNVITLVYNHDFPRLLKGNTINPDINDYLTPFFKENFKINRDTSKKYTIVFNDSLKITYPQKIALGVNHMIGYIPLAEKELHDNEEFRFLIAKSLEFRMYKYQFYKSCIENVKKAIQRIEEKY